LGDVAATAASALAIAHSAKALLNPENHIFDHQINGVAPTVVGSVTGTLAGTLVSDITIGDGNPNRTGTSIKLDEFSWSGSFVEPGSANPHGNSRVLIVRDNYGDQGSSPLLADLLAYPNGAAALASHLRAQAITTERFKVLVDEQFSFNSSASGFAFPKPFEHSRKCKWHQEFLDSSNAGRNSVWLFFFCDTSAAQPTLYANWREFFIDN